MEIEDESIRQVASRNTEFEDDGEHINAKLGDIELMCKHFGDTKGARTNLLKVIEGILRERCGLKSTFVGIDENLKIQDVLNKG